MLRVQMTPVAYILRNRLEGIDADAKLVLVRFAMAVDFRSVEAGVKELASMLGLSDHLVSTGVGQLVAAGLLERRPVSQGRGRPGYRYRISHSLLHQADAADEVRSSSGLGPLPDILVDELACALFLAGRTDKPVKEVGKPPPRTGGGSHLGGHNKLVLATLLAIADRRGVLWCIGPAALGRLMGMSASRVRVQLDKLLTLGYLRAVTSGGTGKRLFGVRAGSVYLDLGHPDYGPRALPSCAVAIPGFDLGFEDRRRVGGVALYKAAAMDRARGPAESAPHLAAVLAGRPQAALEEVTGLGDVVNYFDYVGSPTLPILLQQLIEGCVGKLLSTSWRQAPWEAGRPVEVLCADIGRELLPGALSLLSDIGASAPDGDSGSPSGAMATEERLVNLVAVEVLYLADRIRSFLLANEPTIKPCVGVAWHEADFVVLPAHPKVPSKSLTVSITPKVRNETTMRFPVLDFLQAGRDQRPPLILNAREASVRDQVIYGLRSAEALLRP